MRVDFSLHRPVFRLAAVFQWLFNSRPGFALTLSAALALLGANLYLVLFDTDKFLFIDEAEHLHTVYALERGEVPYRDFLANHPALFHVFLLQLKRLFGLSDVGDMYVLSKSVIYLHFAACITLIACVLRRFCERELGDARYGLVFIIVLPLLGIWASTLTDFWHLRPDWTAYFYAYLAALSHFIMLRRIIQNKNYFGWLILGAAGFGLGAAILSKVILVIIPYMMTLCLATALSLPRWLDALSVRQRWRMFFINCVFAALSLLFLTGFVALELWASNASIREYIQGNYALNLGRQVILYIVHDFNPLTVLRKILDIPAVMVYILAACSFPLLLTLHDRNKQMLKCVVMFVGFTILFNATFTSWSNGVTWHHYFMPSTLSMALYIALIVICLLHYVTPGFSAAARFARLPDAKGGGLAASQLALAYFILLWMAASSAYETARMTAHLHYVGKKDRLEMAGEDKIIFAPDAHLPVDLNYLTFRVEDKPVAAPAWGYFFYLLNVQNFWKNMHRLGLAPDPAHHWRSLYEESPPDAIAVTSLEQLKAYIRQVNFAQGINIDWLLERAKEDYSCISRNGKRPAYVRNDLTQSYLQNNWALCPPENRAESPQPRQPAP